MARELGGAGLTVESLFDAPRFNRSLFCQRPDASPPPRGASDHFIDVDGARLHLRAHAGPSSALLLFHGNREVIADYDDAAQQFADAGLRLLVADFRGYGLSTGTPTLRLALADAPAVLSTAASIVGAPLLVMGRSLGGNCAAELCQHQRPEVRGYVFESSPTDLAALVARRGYVGARFTAQERETFDPLLQLAKCRTPALFLHGTEDSLIVPDEARRGHAVVPGSTLVLIDGRRHHDVSLSAQYWVALRAFAHGAQTEN